MNNPISQLSAKHLHDVYFGGNWTVSSVKAVLENVDHRMALQKVDDLNNIATLLFHTSYFVSALVRVLEGKPIDAHDKYSFDPPPINNEEDWNALKKKAFDEAEKAISQIGRLPDEKLSQIFVEEKYGTWFRNIHGIIEHLHYHLGQMALIKKLLQSRSQASKSI